MEKNKTVEVYINKNVHWGEELTALRNIILQTELDESIKWGAPVYALDGKNVLGIGAFKSYFGLWFFQGVFLEDKDKVLQNAQEGKTKALRQWRFQSLDEIDEKQVLRYVKEAILNQRNGKELKPAKPTKTVTIPKELQTVLTQDSTLNNVFQSFSPSHQREYAEYIAEAKKEETKMRRLEKIIPMILSKGGLHDKYKK